MSKPLRNGRHTTDRGICLIIEVHVANRKSKGPKLCAISNGRTRAARWVADIGVSVWSHNGVAPPAAAKFLSAVV